MLKIDKDGDRRWYNEKDQLHREDGPAYEGADGNKCWLINGKRYRNDGPSFEGFNGLREWWKNGELHRIDGPAVEDSDGNKEYWLNGIQYTESEYSEKVGKYVKDR